MKGNRRKSVLYKYVIFSFCIVMAIFCLFTCIWTVEKATQVKNKQIEEENFLLVLTMEDIENDMAPLQQISRQIILDKSITPYRLRKGGYYTVEALEKLKYYCQSSDIFEDLLICLNNDDTIYRTGGTERFTTMAERSFIIGGTLTTQRLYSLFDQKDQYGFLSVSDQLIYEKKACNLITYPLYSADMNVYGTLAALIDEHFLYNAIKESELASYTMICNGSGQFLYTTVNHEQLSVQLSQLFSDMTDNQHLYTIKSDEGSYMVIAYQSDVTGWYYLRLVNQTDLNAMFWKDVLPSIGPLFFISLVISVIIAILIAFYCYLPLKSLLHLFNPNISYSAKRDELSLINQYVRNLQKESISMKEQIDRQNLQQIREILTEMLYGGGNIVNEEPELFEQYGLQEQDHEFCIILLMPQEEVEETDFQLEFRKENRLLFVTREIGGGYIFLYYAPKGTQSAYEQCSTIYSHYATDRQPIHISMGGYVEEFCSLRDSLNECLLAAELDNSHPISYLRSSYTGNVQEFWKPCKEELLLELAIRGGEKAEILKRSVELETKLSIVIRYYLNNEMQYVFYRIMNYLVLRLRETDAKDHFPEMFQQMRDSKDISEFFEAFRGCVQVIFDDNSTSTNESKGKIVEIKRFIDDHAFLPEMSLGYVADHYGIRDSYLSKLFKDKMGENFIDYLLRLRMEEAARLLRETSMTVKQVVNQVGYEDATSFAKKFSKKYGMTPGVYKKTSSNREDQ